MAFQVRAAQADDVAQAVALLDATWAWQNNKAMLTADPGYELHQTRVGVLDGRVVSMAQVVRRQMWVDGRKVKLGFIGNVVTAAEHRRKGYARAVLLDAIAYMEEHGYELSMLYAAVPQLYAELGWQVVPERVTSFRIKPWVRGCTAQGYGARHGDWDADLRAVATVYDEFNRGRTGAIVRSLPYWRACRQWVSWEDDSRFLVVERAGEVAAYVRGAAKDNAIMELGYRRAEALPALFAAIAGGFDDARLVAHLPADPALDALLAAYAADVSHDAARVPGYEPAMFRPMQGQSLDALAGLCFFSADHL